MSRQEFIKKHNLSDWSSDQLEQFFAIFDELYLNLTAKQIDNLVHDFCAHADDLYNNR